MKIKSLVSGAVLGIGLSGFADAATFAAFDLQTPVTTVGLSAYETFSLAYDTSGWASIDSATLYLLLGDDGDSGPEWAVTAAFGNGSGLAFLTTPISSFTGYALGSVLDLVALGGTSVTGTVFGVGDFLYGGAMMVLEYTQYTPVPEASELWMLAAGLLAVGGIAVKRRSFNQV